MSKFRFTLNTLAVAAFLLAVTSMANAQATRTWVSGVGDDANPCSRTAPCKTFAGAISKTATGGEIDALDPGGFGTVTITKALTIDGTTGSGFGSALSALTTGVIVNAPATAVVTLRNLSINGVVGGSQPGVDGMRIIAAKTVIVDNCRIFGFSQQGIDASGLIASSELIVTGSHFQNITLEGIKIATTTGQAIAMVDRSNFQRCGTGIFAGDRTRVGVSDSVFSHNTNGLVSTSAANDSQVNIDGCFFTYGTVGIQAGTGTVTLRVSRSVIVQNSTGINLVGAGVATSNGNNTVYGNGAGEAFSGAIVPQK